MTEDMIDACRTLFTAILKKLDEIKKQNQDLLDVEHRNSIIKRVVWEGVKSLQNTYIDELQKMKKKDGMDIWQRLKKTRTQFSET